MKVIELSKFKRSKASFFGTQPYTMCFCYPKSGPVIVKGMAGEVEKYVDNRLGPCHYRYVYFKDGKSRGGWKVNRPGIYLSLNKHKNGHERFRLILFDREGKVIKERWMRRVPNRYIKDLDEIR